MIRDGSKLGPASTQLQQNDRKKRRKAQVKRERYIQTQRSVHVLLIFVVFDQLFGNSIMFVRFQRNNFGKKLQTAEPCDAVMRRQENITDLYPYPDF